MTQSPSQGQGQYLILHKVRGQPQFDVAEKATIGDEEGWILCTCGHRAYPYKWWTLDGRVPSDMFIPGEWPDHYEQPGLAPTSEFNIFNVISAIVPKMKRRI